MASRKSTGTFGLAVVIGGLAMLVSTASAAQAELKEVRTVWTAEDSGMPHNAFTDLIRFRGMWYLGFREALKHHGGLAGKGRLRVLRSKDGRHWESCGLFTLTEGDLRDAKLSVTAAGELMLNSAIQVYRPDPVKHKNFAWFSKDGTRWSRPVQFGESDIWIWSVTWHEGAAYGVGYPTTGAGKKLTGGKTTLYKSENGRNWEVLVRSFHPGNEASIAFKMDGTAVCLMRSGRAIGQAKAPYTDWTWKGTVSLGGPKLIRLPDGRFIAGGRGGWGSMLLYEMDPDTGRAKRLISLPARGDSSYPGLVRHDGLIWVSYYASTDDATEGGRYLVPTEVRLAKVRMPEASSASKGRLERLDDVPRLHARQEDMAGYAKTTYREQKVALEKDAEVIRFRRMREAKAEDRYRPAYHFSTPEGLLNDPNGFCYWRGNYHMFYQLQAAGTGTMQWGHAVSPDLVHWQDLPIAIRRESGSGAIFSGQVLVEKDRVIAMFHDTTRGNCIAIANDPLLLAFAKTGVNPWGGGKFTGQGFQKLFDPCIWKGKDGAYYSVSGVCKKGGRTSNGFPVADLFRSEDLKNWVYLGMLLSDEDWKRMGLGPGDDSAVPNFQPIARRDGTPSGKHMYLWFSHGKGAHAMVGTYDEERHHFSPESYRRMTYGPVYRGTLHAPSAMLDEKGRLLAIFNVRENLQDVREALRTESPKVWYGVMTLARHFWLDEDNQLRVEPAGDIASLRVARESVPETSLAADEEKVLGNVAGDALELRVRLIPGSAKQVGIKVLRSPDGKEFTSIAYNPETETLALDVSNGSQRDDVPARAAEVGPLRLAGGEPLNLWIFIDRSIVEVYANDKQSLTARVYPAGSDSRTVAVFAAGGEARLASVEAWQMKSIWQNEER